MDGVREREWRWITCEGMNVHYMTSLGGWKGLGWEKRGWQLFFPHCPLMIWSKRVEQLGVWGGGGKGIGMSEEEKNRRKERKL